MGPSAKALLSAVTPLGSGRRVPVPSRTKAPQVAAAIGEGHWIVAPTASVKSFTAPC